MKPRLLLLSLSVIGFYLFTDFKSQLGDYFSSHNLHFGYVGFDSKPRIVNAVSSLFTFVLGAIISYTNFFLLFYKIRQKVLAVVMFLIVVIPLSILFRYCIQEVLVYQIWGIHNYSTRMLHMQLYFMDNTYYFTYYCTFGMIFFFLQLSAYHQKMQNELLLQNRNAELSFLRSQINPHFLFNSLNNVYTLVYQSSPNALPSISKLSELLRYMLYEKAEVISLDKEVQYLFNYIDLQLMRYNFKVAKQINIHIPPNSGLLIAPLTLIPFVENAFKHGDLKEALQPLMIDLSVDDNQLNLRVVNKKSNFNKDETGGIGLDNVKKRLKLIYENKHRLTIEETAHLFTVNLCITLHD
jgi:two-component system LytT family sensor kinase